MTRPIQITTWAVLAIGLAAGDARAGDPQSEKAPDVLLAQAQRTKGGPKPVFTLAWSEYPSWSVFGVASDKGLINGKEGRYGTLEEKWGVDIKLQLLQYDPCITAYQTKQSDAVCITNMDVLNPALSRKSVAIMPTSTSDGADACIVVGINSVQDLRRFKVYGLSESVSQYTFARCLELMGEKESDHKFSQMDPEKAAQAMQAKASGVNAIMVWNPFVLQTLKSRKDARVLFDSSKIPEEIIDMVVVGQDVLDRPGGDRFASAVAETYYKFNTMLANRAQRDDLLVALGEKFSSLGRADMEVAVTKTHFYKTPHEALALFTGEKFPKTMKTIVDFYVGHGILKPAAPSIGFGTARDAPSAQLRFDPTYIKAAMGQK